MAYVRASKRVRLLRACIRGVLDLLLARRAERVAVMQIGAHLAWMNYNDPFGSVVRHTLNRRNATAFLAVVVEPQPHVFQRLRQSSKQFAASGVVRFENVAVCASGAASVDFFLVDPSVDMVSGRDNRTGIRAPRWTSQIASLDRSQVVRKMPRVLRNAANYSEDTYIKRVRVPCASIAELVARHGIASESFGLLRIDTEGHDVKILQASPLHEFRPWILTGRRNLRRPTKSARCSTGCGASATAASADRRTCGATTDGCGRRRWPRAWKCLRPTSSPVLGAAPRARPVTRLGNLGWARVVLESKVLVR